MLHLPFYFLATLAGYACGWLFPSAPWSAILGLAAGTVYTYRIAKAYEAKRLASLVDAHEQQLQATFESAYTSRVTPETIAALDDAFEDDDEAIVREANAA